MKQKNTTTKRTDKARKTQRKHMKPWKVLVLSIVTGEIYPLFWINRQQNEVLKHRSKYGHWGWPVGFIASYFVVIFSLYYVLFAKIEDSHLAAILAIVCSYSAALLMIGGLTWWSSRIIIALNKSLGIRVPVFLVTLMALFFSPGLVAFEQSLLNNHPLPGTSKRNIYKRSSLIIATGVLISFLYLALLLPGTELSKFENEHADFRRDMSAMRALSTEYNACTYKLDADYPEDEITEDKYDAYLARYNSCDEIYQRIQSL